MSKYNIRTDSYFKEQIMNRGKNLSSACNTLISGIPHERINRLSAMSFDEAKMYVNYVYADFDSTKNFSTKTAFSVRLSYDSENIINQCSTTWGTKANKSEVIRILLAVGIMCRDDKCYNSKETKPLSFKMSRSIKIPPSIKTASSSNTLLSTKISPPYICYQHGNKNNPNIKSEITKILEQIPDDIQTVVEPFMGMCALTINVLDTLSDRTLDYYVNDMDINLFNLYNCTYKNTNKLLCACKRLVNHLRNKTDTFETVKKRHSIHNNDYDAAADYMYLDAVSVRHDKQTLKKDKNGNDIDTDKQIKLFNKYIANIGAMHNYLIKTKISHKDALKMLKKFKNREKTLYLFDPKYLESQGYSSETNDVDEFTYDNHEGLTSFSKNNISPDSIFLLFCRFTSTRSLKKGENYKDIKIKELNGYFEADDRILRGFYKRVFGVETKGSKHKFFYKEIPFDSKRTIEVIISNYQFDGFKPF